jgi:hypothetical protein
MTEANISESELKQRMKELEEFLVGGFEHGELHLLKHKERGMELVMFLMDAEYDPVRITYCPEGLISIHADGHQWHMFDADQLEFIKEKAVEAVEIWEDYYAENPDD